jgi:hypothetical protein
MHYDELEEEVQNIDRERVKDYQRPAVFSVIVVARRL